MKDSLSVTPPGLDDPMAEIRDLIALAQGRFAARLERYLASDVPRIDAYHRYLSFQYHLTKGVQVYFFRLAASARLARMRRLRKFFVQFANEEELHYLVAASDLEALDLDILPEPFDVALWHAYFSDVVDDHPFIRAGAALILENISDGVARDPVKRALSAEFMTARNTKFLVLHQHETLPHGDQLMEAIAAAPLSPEDRHDLVLGAKQGAVLYLRMVDWALGGDPLIDASADGGWRLDAQDKAEIARFDMADLALEP